MAGWLTIHWQRLRPYVAALLLLSVAFLYYNRIRVPRETDAVIESRQRLGAQAFVIVIGTVSGIWEEAEREEARARTDEGPMLRAWEKYQAVAISGEYSDFKSCQRSRNGIVTLFHFSDARSWITGLRVAVPNRRISTSNYVAMAVISNSVGERGQTWAVVYSPTSPDELYVAKLQRDDDESAWFLRLVSSYDWKLLFDPDSQVWPFMYKINPEYPQLRTLHPR